MDLCFICALFRKNSLFLTEYRTADTKRHFLPTVIFLQLFLTFPSKRHFPPTIAPELPIRAVYILDVCRGAFYAYDVKLLLLICRNLQFNGKTVI